jgi:hypothetical protein
MTTEKQLVANRENARRSTGPRTEDGKAVSRMNALRHGLLSRLEVLPGLEEREDWEAHYGAVVDALEPEGYLEETLAGRVALQLWRLGRVVRYEWEAAAAVVRAADEVEPVAGLLDALYTPDPETARRNAQEAQERADWLSGLEDLPDETPVEAGRAALLLDEAATAVGVNIYSGGSGGVDVSFPGYPDGVELEEVSWAARNVRECLDAIAKGGKVDRALLVRVVSMRWKTAAVKVRNRAEIAENRVESRRRRGFLPEKLDAEKVNRYETAIERSLYKTLHELERLQERRWGGVVPPPVAVDVNVDNG